MAATHLHPESGRAIIERARRDRMAADAKFWSAYAAWRLAEDTCEREANEEDGTWDTLCDAATNLRDVVLSCGVFSARALLTKLKVIEEGSPASVMDMMLPGGFSVFEVVLWDCERLAKIEFHPELDTEESLRIN